MIIHEIPAEPKEEKKVRVAVYARVSSEKDATYHSLEAQTDYYEQYIAARQDWELVGIYSDNGISGTTINRPEFQRMLVDCRNGMIDLVVTKSITRFARNTVTLLETIRELKSLGIDCYFEKEDMHSISPDGELLLTLLAMYAEEEARSVSENQKWRIKKRFEKGEPWVGKMLGYRLVDRELKVVPDEANTVRRIFNMYLSGMGLSKIASILTREQVPTKNGGEKWSKYSVGIILQNEKYTGNMILQKTYNDDFRTKNKVINHGERRRYFVENSHDAIIDNELFEAAQEERERRKSLYKGNSEKVPKAKHIFAGVIRCGICGHHYTHMRTNTGKYDKAVYQCNGYNVLGKGFCPSQKIPEDILLEKTLEVLGVAELSRETIRNQIKEIVVPEHNHMVYYLFDGGVVDVPWQHRSRSESWTPEMRQAAREKALARARKEDK